MSLRNDMARMWLRNKYGARMSSRAFYVLMSKELGVHKTPAAQTITILLNELVAKGRATKAYETEGKRRLIFTILPEE